MRSTLTNTVETTSDRAVIYRAATVLHDGLQEATGMLVRDGQVAEVGDAAALATQHGDAQVVDFGDATITPGLIDGHIHAIWGVALARGANLANCTSLDEVKDALRAEAERVGGDEWVFGYGFEPHLLGDAPVTNDFIHDAVGAERPVYITMFDAHSALLSGAALAACQVTESATFIDGGGFTERTDADERQLTGAARLTGHVLEWIALDHVQRHVPRIPVAEQADTLYNNLSEMAHTGLVGGYTPDLQNPDTFAVLEAIEADRELPVRIRISPWCTPEMSAEEVDALADMKQHRGRRWEVEGVKLFIDGTIDGGTAWLEEPDAFGEGTRGFWHDPEQYARNLRRLNELGVPTITHAIGDRGVRFVAETIANLPNNGTRHRIDHLELVADEVIEFIGEHDISVCVQPNHCTLFMHADGTDTWSKRLGESRNKQGWKTRSYLEHGITEALASDWPVAPFDPRTIIADAQLRHPHDRNTPPIHPEQALTASEALTGYTESVPASVGRSGAALRVGEPADFTVWARNPLETPASELADVAIVATAIDGSLVFNDHR